MVEPFHDRIARQMTSPFSDNGKKARAVE